MVGIIEVLTIGDIEIDWAGTTEWAGIMVGVGIMVGIMDLIIIGVIIIGYLILFGIHIIIIQHLACMVGIIVGLVILMVTIHLTPILDMEEELHIIILIQEII